MKPCDQQLALAKLMGKKIGKRKNKQGFLIQACPSCSSYDVRVSDCGYTTYNPGKATCNNCGHAVKAQHVDSERDMVPVWNNYCVSRILPDINDLAFMRQAAMELAHRSPVLYSRYHSALVRIVTNWNAHPDCKERIACVDADGPQRAEAILRGANLWKD